MVSFDRSVPPVGCGVPIELTASKRRALLACLAGDGALYQCRGAWTDSAGASDLISGITVANLVRDGLLVSSSGETRLPLTPLGQWYAHSCRKELQRATSTPGQARAETTAKVNSG